MLLNPFFTIEASLLPLNDVFSVNGQEPSKKIISAYSDGSAVSLQVDLQMEKIVLGADEKKGVLQNADAHSVLTDHPGFIFK